MKTFIHATPRLTMVAIVSGALAAGPLEVIAQAASEPASSEREGNPVTGAVLFQNEVPRVHGNGRTCATCHVPKEAFQLTPESVERRFQALQQKRQKEPNADDPLFRPIDANDGAEDFTNLRRHGLVRVIIPLPLNANGAKLVWPVDDPEATEVSLWRAVPTVLNTAFTAPYQQDGREPTLQSQALGALVLHSEITVAPKPRALDDLAAFQSAQFSSVAVRELARALSKGETPPPTDPPLTPLEVQGKALFERHCAVCHGGPTQTVPLADFPPGIADIFVSKPPPPYAADLPFAPSPLLPRLWAFRVDGQAEPVILPSTDPGKALLTGNPSELNFFDIPALYGISKTAPYFHDNSAATLEDMIRHYQLVFEATRRVIPDFLPWPLRPDPITDDQFEPLIAYLKKI
jgi:cytochrome c peroxidase